MPASIGPRFYMEVTAPKEWNHSDLLEPHQVAVRSSQNDGFIVEVFSGLLKQKLLNSSDTVCSIYLAQIIREDAESLFAFGSLEERAVFLELRNLDSIGPKLAATIVSSLGPSQLKAMSLGDLKAAGLKITGLGPKTLDKLISGLKSEQKKFLPILMLWEKAVHGTSSEVSRTVVSSGGFSAIHSQGNAPVLMISALEKLGLKAFETQRIYNELSQVDEGFSTLATGEMLKRILQYWGKTKTRRMDIAAEETL